MHSTRHLRIVSAATIVALGAALAGCSTPAPEPGGDTAAQQLDPVTVGVIPVIGLGSFYTAVDQGFFEDHGLDVTAEPLAAGAALIPALEAGAMQFGSINPVSVLQAVSSGIDIQVLGVNARKTGEGAGLPIALAPGVAGDITDASDLEGRTIAVNSVANMNQLAAQTWLADNGADPSKVSFVAVNFPDMIPALIDGRVDAAVLDEPFGSIAAGQGIDFLTDRAFEAVADEPIFGVWVVSSRWLEEHEAEADAFIAAMEDAAAYLDENPDDIRRILVEQIALNPAIAEQVVVADYHVPATVKDFKVWMDAAREYDLIPSDVDIESFASRAIG
jgi:NitT/TauT family transport system substrate-binding protein